MISKLKMLEGASGVAFVILKEDGSAVYPEEGKSDPGFPFSVAEFHLSEDAFPFLFEKEEKLYAVLKKDSLYLVFGPASEEEKENAGISSVANLRFVYLIAYLEEELNQHSVSPGVLLTSEKKVSEEIERKATESRVKDSKDHGTYYFEQMILDYIKKGDAKGLKPFLIEYTRQTSMKIGKLADDQLRQAKNVAIGLTAVTGKFGAIPGGLDIEETYRLIDVYSQKFENASNVSTIAELQLSMLLDFAERVHRITQKKDYSIDVDYALQYIKNHANQIVGVMDVVTDVGKSRSYLLKKFKEEVGMPMGKYIMKCKLDGAAMTLCYSNLPLIEISNYFNFSSQSYFQNTFKKQFGVTPTVYRKAKGKIN